MFNDQQYELTKLCLNAVGGAGFALAGSGAIREHGVICRPTEDVDLFAASSTRVEVFAQAADALVSALAAAGYKVSVVRRADVYARFSITDSAGNRFEVDLGIDWRKKAPVLLEIGPVLSLVDAVASKVVAVYSRNMARDYLDLDQIRVWGVFSDAELLSMAKDRDPGFTESVFATQLRFVDNIRFEDVAPYGISLPAFQECQQRLRQWADLIDTWS